MADPAGTETVEKSEKTLKKHPHPARERTPATEVSLKSQSGAITLGRRPR